MIYTKKKKVVYLKFKFSLASRELEVSKSDSEGTVVSKACRIAGTMSFMGNREFFSLPLLTSSLGSCILDYPRDTAFDCGVPLASPAAASWLGQLHSKYNMTQV